MDWVRSGGRGLGFTVLVLAAATTACTDADPKVPPTAELSDFKLTIADTRHATATVHYRFTKGRPRPGKWYKVQLSITAEMNNRGFDLFAGEASSLATEGTLSQECTIDPPGKAWKPGETVKYQIALYEGFSKDDRYKSISNVLDGQAQVP
jgi:hypothetical protein